MKLLVAHALDLIDDVFPVHLIVRSSNLRACSKRFFYRYAKDGHTYE